MKFRKYEVWKDYWCFEPLKISPLNLLKELNYYCWSPRKNNQINIRLESYNNEEVPSDNQVKTLEYVINNEIKIINGIWEYYKNLILPIYITAIDIEEEDIIRNKSELSKVFGVKAIEIPPLESVNSIYYLIEFEFKYDCEHGLYLLFKNDKPIDLFSEGDKNYDAIDIHEKGLYNKDKKKLKIRIEHINGTLVVEGNYFFDETIEIPLKKGVYRIFYIINNSQRFRSFIVNKNLRNFTLEYVLRNCENKKNHSDNIINIQHEKENIKNNETIVDNNRVIKNVEVKKSWWKRLWS